MDSRSGSVRRWLAAVLGLALLWTIGASAADGSNESGVATPEPDTQRVAVELATALATEIAAGVIEVESSDRTILIRVKEHGSFASGSADLTPNFRPVLKIIRNVLKDVPGEIAVEGHTADLVGEVPLELGALERSRGQRRASAARGTEDR
jgi:outer membrane protein OmpA-like peptidoglycan-associated protein